MVFEVNALSPKNISVSFQHPLDDSLVTLEFNLKDVSHPHCRLHAVANAADIIPTLEELACRVVQRYIFKYQPQWFYYVYYFINYFFVRLVCTCTFN